MLIRVAKKPCVSQSFHLGGVAEQCGGVNQGSSPGKKRGQCLRGGVVTKRGVSATTPGPEQHQVRRRR